MRQLYGYEHRRSNRSIVYIICVCVLVAIGALHFITLHMIALGETFRNPDEDLARVIADWILDSPIGEQPRSVGEAVQMTIAKCRAAAALPEDERKAAMEAAFKRFEEFCRSRGVSGERFQGFRESIRAAIIKSKGAVDTSVAA